MPRSKQPVELPLENSVNAKAGISRKKGSPHPSTGAGTSNPAGLAMIEDGTQKRKPRRPRKELSAPINEASTSTSTTKKAGRPKKEAMPTNTSSTANRNSNPNSDPNSTAQNPAQSSARRMALQSVHPLVLGIDFGGSGIKGAPVDLEKGLLAVDRTRYDTPQPSTPAACTDVIAQLVTDFDSMIAVKGPIGVTFPGVVWDGTTLTAANVDLDWIDCDADAMLEERLKRKVTVINDAQAAALAEVHYGAGRGVNGMVLMLTFGTGIGSGLVYRGVALPGVELGHVRMHGRDAEQLAAASVKDNKKLSWKEWSSRVNDYLARIERMLWPELIIIGGGVSEEPEKFLSRLKTRTPVVPAKLGNAAGIVGAAIAASRQV